MRIAALSRPSEFRLILREEITKMISPLRFMEDENDKLKRSVDGHNLNSATDSVIVPRTVTKNRFEVTLIDDEHSITNNEEEAISS